MNYTFFFVVTVLVAPLIAFDEYVPEYEQFVVSMEAEATSDDEACATE